MTNFVPALKAEIAELKADLSINPDPRVRKLQRLEATLAEYEPATKSKQPVNGSVVEPSPAFSLATETKATRMKNYIDGVLANGKVHRKALLDGLIESGIMGQEKSPMQALAIFLSTNSENYASDGAGNFSLKGR